MIGNFEMPSQLYGRELPVETNKYLILTSLKKRKKIKNKINLLPAIIFL